MTVIMGICRRVYYPTMYLSLLHIRLNAEKSMCVRFERRTRRGAVHRQVLVNASGAPTDWLAQQSWLAVLGRRSPVPLDT